MLGWLALTVTLLVSLTIGGILPIAWVALCAVVIALFAVQVFLDFLHGVPLPGGRVLPIAVLYFGVVGWLQIQTMTGLPESLSHPVWNRLPDTTLQTISARPELGQQIVMRLTCYGMIFWIMMRSSLSNARVTAYIRAIALFSTCLAVYGIQAKLSGVNPLLGDAAVHGPVRASFINRNSYATYAVFGILANIVLYYQMTYRNQGLPAGAAVREYLESFFAGGWIFALGGLLGLAALAMTESRAGGAAGLIGIVVLIWSLQQSDRKGHVLLWMVLAIVIGFVLLTSTGNVVDRMANNSDDARFVIFPHVIDGILERPVLGHGGGAFLDTFRVHVPLEMAMAEWSMAHSTYLENLYEFGVPAAGTFFLALFLIAVRLLRGVRSRRQNQFVPSFALACFVAAAFHATVDFSLQMPAVAALFAAILGMGWAQSFSTKAIYKRSQNLADL